MKKLYYPFLLLFISFFSLFCCSSTSTEQVGTASDRRAFTQTLAEEIDKVLPSAIEVVAIIEYEVHEYLYALDINGNFIEDPASPFGFRMISANPDSMVLKRKESQVAFGSGVFIGKNESAYLILTSRHVVSHEDTIVQYIHIDNKRTTAPLIKAYLKRHDLAVRWNNALVAASLFAEEVRSDLALLTVSSRLVSGKIMANEVDKNNKSEWGRLAIIIGFPDEIKQVAMGLTGGAPYPGNFSISTYGDFGYSGGPVFAYTETDGLVFIGIGRSIPAKTIFYIAPDENIKNRYFLLTKDIEHLTIQRFPLVNPSRVYAVNMEYVTDFIRKNYRRIFDKNFNLSANLRKFK